MGLMHPSVLFIKPDTPSFHSWFLMISSWIPPVTWSLIKQSNGERKKKITVKA